MIDEAGEEDEEADGDSDGEAEADGDAEAEAEGLALAEEEPPESTAGCATGSPPAWPEPG
ncbi:hypothetical protein ACQP2P_45170 [Dactylosporangium sp. CA-139114]|uniref:hypothetical protein n=1 Tax=Dactylosporangium sp. CA-139114 TaxID=3239931 RepID=UPI003D9886F0